MNGRRGLLSPKQILRREAVWLAWPECVEHARRSLSIHLARSAVCGVSCNRVNSAYGQLNCPEAGVRPACAAIHGVAVDGICLLRSMQIDRHVHRLELPGRL